jgi:hypothetical protein
MPAYSSTSPPALPGCPLSSRPTVSTQSFVRTCSRCHAAVPFNFHCPLSCLKSKTIILGSHICDLRRRASPCRHGVCKLFSCKRMFSVAIEFHSRGPSCQLSDAARNAAADSAMFFSVRGVGTGFAAPNAWPPTTSGTCVPIWSRWLPLSRPAQMQRRQARECPD